jgi:hypothetical protein
VHFLKFDAQKNPSLDSGWAEKAIGKKSDRKTAFSSGKRGVRQERISKNADPREMPLRILWNKSKNTGKLAFFATAVFRPH